MAWAPEPGTQTILTVLIIIFLILNYIGVGLRCFVRIRINNSFSYDDWAMLASLVGYSGMCGTLLAAMIYGFGAAIPQPWYDPIKAAQLVYVVAAYLCKLSVALVLLRIAGTDRKSLIRKVLIGAIIVVTIFAVATFLALALQCRPVTLNWGVGKGECVAPHVITDIAYAFSAADIASGWLFSTLPIVMLWSVQLSLRVKLSVIILLGFSFTSSIATLVRLKYVVDLGSLGSTDPGLPLRLLDSIIWSHLEIALAIFAASLAALRPLLKFISWGGGDSTAAKSSAWSDSRSKGRMTPAIRLDNLKDNQFDDGGSQEFILHTGQDQAKFGREGQAGIYKTTRVEVSHHAV
ncbi:hypothetical protein O1611_g895 [Lasiodiplodia mahajangana]|uniref:Uncharacterized protein n=1 Tax=Lasiodiplodia mahajangana TaxID=1108764 RepID=A0ACC2JZ92_9PEZI|nr:hypothetical protein O1611_g895 [Lasiodiplodia mahajangana]